MWKLKPHAVPFALSNIIVVEIPTNNRENSSSTDTNKHEEQNIRSKTIKTIGKTKVNLVR